MTEINICRLYINGQWKESKATRYEDVTNSSTGEVIARTPLCPKSEIQDAVASAKAAFPAWREVPVSQRVQVLYRLKRKLEEHKDELAKILSIENGKTFVESQGCLVRTIDLVDYACGMPNLMMGLSLENVTSDVDSVSYRQPLGVCAGISPFNFPIMVPVWLYPFAIACGNTFVLKPSEKVPLSTTREIELLSECGLPPGVVNMIHGDKEAVDALIEARDVKAISFVGSAPVGQYIYKEASARGKRVQALCGAKNYMIWMPDAHVDKTIDNIISSSYGCAGERCLAGSILIVVGDKPDQMIKSLTEATKKIKVGPALDPSTGLGPLVTKAHMEKVIKYIEKGVAEGAKILLDGRGVKVQGHPNGFYLGPTLFDMVKPNMTIAREEIFGPVLSIIRAKDFNEAMDIANASCYGNASCIFTSNGKTAREYAHRIEAGMVGINVGVPAPMGYFPFAGWKDSFCGDLHAHGRDGVAFYTETKVTMTRWF